jgi:broad specificity phosphatase PhoE
LEAKMKIWTVSHLPVENNFLGRVTGLNDQDLAPIALDLAPHVNLGNSSIYDAVVVSHLRRAQQTADLCCKAMNVPLFVDRRVAAIDFGTMHSETKDCARRYRRERFQEPFPEGESYQEMADRYSEWLAELKPRMSDANILLISHESTDAVLSHLEDPTRNLRDEILEDDSRFLQFKATSPTQLDYVSAPPRGPDQF